MNHLWQTTAFVVIVWGITLALKKSHPRVRYWIWFAASVKFLIPFSLLVSFGSRFSWRPPEYIPRSAGLVATGSVQPAAEQPLQLRPPTDAATSASLTDTLYSVLFFVWALGCATVLLRWFIRWRNMQRLVQESSPLTDGREFLTLKLLEPFVRLRQPLRLVSSGRVMEPCVFGILRPSLVLPAQLSDKLQDSQLQAILLHELSHVRFYDNLSASVHMVVEAVFWFHPLVWWIGRQLVDEREKACDRDVLQFGIAADAYAESILRVCEFCLESPLRCAAGITGAQLKTRVEEIMRHGFSGEVRFRHVLVLIAAFAIVLLSPVVFGFVHPIPQVREAFEVASIKPRKFQPGMVGISFLPGGVVRGEQAPIWMIISDAYGISMKQLDMQTVPKAVMEDVYDFEAKAGVSALPATAPAKERNQQVRRMLQTLLADRFKLELHTEQRETPVYALSVAPKGPKFEVSATDRKCPESREDPFVARFGEPCGRLAGGPASGVKGWNITVAKLIETLEDFGDRRVIDRTGITGHFDAALPPWNRASQFPKTSSNVDPEAAAREPAVEDPNGPSIFTVIQQTLGLRLESARAPVETYVIDHIERPTPN